MSLTPLGYLNLADLQELLGAKLLPDGSQILAGLRILQQTAEVLGTGPQLALCAVSLPLELFGPAGHYIPDLPHEVVGCGGHLPGRVLVHAEVEQGQLEQVPR